ncbi:SAM-dependent methyltransferase [Nicoliella spurrieriana]|uniref:SAM-dependent methyltransferase n=2 Tax=Nicoliella spurrieriana TaxID=2925830 RepID=A0A976RST4_9LACO|nr:SAM-dependent methyltransferase [Nicoliella spurrieriana]UQS87158.1 SAM-dependent methyltransferase [Nicoliella spurrieriana]
MSDKLLSNGNLPQDLPNLLLPDNIQDTIFKAVNNQFPADSSEGDRLWERYSNALPKLDKQLRSFRDYLETQYGMWAYISAPFTKAIADFVGNDHVLEVMAGNGYISKGLRNNNVNVVATDSLEWVQENETGKHLVTNVEKLDAMAAFHKYESSVDTIIMCWSPDGVPIDWELLQAIRQSPRDIRLIVIGEKNGATNSKAFWEHAQFVDLAAAKQLNVHHQPFDLIHDQLYVVK